MKQVNALSSSENRLTILAENKMDMELQLNSAFALMLDRARAQGDKGILVTRHSPAEFSLELHSNVPFGMTYEADAW